MSIKTSSRQLSIEEVAQRDAAIEKQRKIHKAKKSSLLTKEDIEETLRPAPSATQKDEELKWSKKLRIRTQFNAHEFEHPGEVNNLPSLTVPDQTMSIKEILERHARGLGITDGKVPLYSGGSDYLDGIDPRTLDIAEKFEILETVQERYDQRRADLEKQTQELKKKEMEDMIKQEVENRLKQKQSPGENPPA